MEMLFVYIAATVFLATYALLQLRLSWHGVSQVEFRVVLAAISTSGAVFFGMAVRTALEAM